MQTNKEIAPAVVCSKHGPRADAVYVDCWNCGGSGELDGECTCMDDTCCCLEPEMPFCDNCNGNGGYMIFDACHYESEKDQST